MSGEDYMESKVCSGCSKLKPLVDFHKHAASSDGHRYRCKECRRVEHSINPAPAIARARKSYELNKEDKIQYARDYYKSNREKAIKQTSEYKSNKRRVSPVFNLKCNIARRLRLNLNRTKTYTEKSMMYGITGINGEAMRNYLHSTFESNYGMPREWITNFKVEIDHIIPLSTAKTIEDVKRLNHYTNLQLLFKEDNQAKGTNLLDFSNQLV